MWDEDPQFHKPYSPRRCKYYEKRHCAIRDPVSRIFIHLYFITDGIYICANCLRREQIDTWFKNLQETEIPSVLPQFHNWKGRLIPKGEQAWNFGPPSDDSCWQYHSIIHNIHNNAT